MYNHCLFVLSQDDEINQQSQLVEKLKEQMLDQEEVTAFSSKAPPCSYKLVLHVSILKRELLDVLVVRMHLHVYIPVCVCTCSCWRQQSWTT